MQEEDRKMSDAQIETVKAAKAAKPAEKQPEAVATKPEKQPRAAAPAAEALPMVPESMREAVETGVTRAKESYEMAKDTAEEATEALKDATEALEETTEALEETFAAAMRGASHFNEQVMAAFKDEASAQLDLMRDLARIGTPLEAFELQGKFLRARLDAAQARGKALAEVCCRVAEDTAAPARESMLRTIRALTPAA
jgi:hypothetical protein